MRQYSLDSHHTQKARFFIPGKAIKPQIRINVRGWMLNAWLALAFLLQSLTRAIRPLEGMALPHLISNSYIVIHSSDKTSQYFPEGLENCIPQPTASS